MRDIAVVDTDGLDHHPLPKPPHLRIGHTNRLADQPALDIQTLDGGRLARRRAEIGTASTADDHGRAATGVDARRRRRIGVRIDVDVHIDVAASAAARRRGRVLAARIRRRRGWRRRRRRLAARRRRRGTHRSALRLGRIGSGHDGEKARHRHQSLDDPHPHAQVSFSGQSPRFQQEPGRSPSRMRAKPFRFRCLLPWPPPCAATGRSVRDVSY